MLERLEVEKWLELNARLQTKKNALRKALREKGVLKKGATNNYDKYSYFSEAQYKELFTELFSQNGLELKFDEVEYGTFDGTDKQANGRMPKLQFTLFDIDTGFGETTTITGEGIDKGDKAGYKAYTGALKYYLADTFMVATGDDPEKDSPDYKMNKRAVQHIDQVKVEALVKKCADDGVDTQKLCQFYKVNRFADLTETQHANIIQHWDQIKEKAGKE